jgi:hypothetical protein
MSEGKGAEKQTAPFFMSGQKSREKPTICCRCHRCSKRFAAWEASCFQYV